MSSHDMEISLDPGFPTEFAHRMSATLPEGSELLDANTWKKVKLPITMHCDVTARATGYLKGQTFRGHFTSEMRIVNIAFPPVVLEGEFYVRLA